MALRDGHLELDGEEPGQFLLSESRVPSFLLSQPGPTLRRGLVRMTVAVVNEGLPARASLAVAAAELRQVVPAEGKAQFLAEGVKVLPLVEAQEKLLLGQSSFDLTGGVALHGIPPVAEMVP
jgi:hypothetical protein